MYKVGFSAGLTQDRLIQKDPNSKEAFDDLSGQGLIHL